MSNSMNDGFYTFDQVYTTALQDAILTLYLKRGQNLNTDKICEI